MNNLDPRPEWQRRMETIIALITAVFAGSVVGYAVTLFFLGKL